MKSIGIDLGEKCGWSVSATSSGKRKVELLDCGLIHTKPGRFESLGMRFLRFENAIRGVLTEHAPEVLFFEEVRAHSAVQAAQMWGGYSSVLMKVADELRIPYQGLPVATIKTHATGNHMAKKERMIQCAQAMWPEFAGKLKDDNTADSAWVAYTGLLLLSGQTVGKKKQ